MLGQTLIEFIERQVALDEPSDAFQLRIRNLFRSAGPYSQNLKMLLNGTWLGHPLHPVLTDIPIGSWTLAVVLDGIGIATGRDELNPGADLAVAIGVAGALGAAVTGFTDWSDTDSRPRRVGLGHALINISATAFFVSSLSTRRSNRRIGIILGFMGYGVMSAGAFLGGHLVFEERIGVNHAAQPLTDEFIPVLAESDLPDNVLRRVEADGVSVVLARHAGAIYALVETCAHLGGPLSQGTLEDGNVRCPWHNSCFSLEDGHVINSPSVFPQPCFETRVRNGQIEVRAK